MIFFCSHADLHSHLIAWYNPGCWSAGGLQYFVIVLKRLNGEFQATIAWRAGGGGELFAFFFFFGFVFVEVVASTFTGA